MDISDMANIGLGAIATIFGAINAWFLNLYKDLKKSISHVEEKANNNSEQIANVQLYVAQNYMTRQEMLDQYKMINFKLDKMMDKLDGKADKE